MTIEVGEEVTLATIAERLAALRLHAGQPSFAELTRRIATVRAVRGLPEVEQRPARATVYDCFRTDRRRLDIDLVTDIVRALGVSEAESHQWAAACRIAQHNADAATLVKAVDWVPDAVRPFVGRDTELAQLTRAGGPPATWISGMPGAGKSQLAYTAARALLAAGTARRAITVDLRGYSSEGPPADSAAVLTALLRLLGVPARQQPSGTTARLDRLAAVLAEQPTVIVLDDAADADQVAPLLHLDGARWLVTSRTTGPAGVRRLDLGLLQPEDTVHLLRSGWSTEPSTAEVQILHQLASVTGHLPLAAALTAARLASRPTWTLSDHLDAARARTEALLLDDPLEQALEVSYRALSPQGRTLLRLWAAQPLAVLGPAEVAALAAGVLTEPQAAIDELVGEHLLSAPRPDRLSMHQTVRLHATERSIEDDAPTWRQEAADRLAHHLLTQAWSAHRARALSLGRNLRQPRSAVDHQELTAEQASELLEAKVDLFLAAALAGRAWPTSPAVDLSEALWDHLEAVGRHHEARPLHQEALRLATERGDQLGQVRARTDLGCTLVRLGRYPEAVAEFSHVLCRAEDYPREAAASANGHGLIALRQGLLEEAQDWFERAIAYARNAAEPSLEISARNNLAGVHNNAGRPEQARAALVAAREAAAAIGDQINVAGATINLAQVLAELGRHEEAHLRAREALETAERLGLTQGVILAAANAGHALRAQDRGAEALEWYRRALAAARTAGAVAFQAEMLGNLAAVHRELQEVEAAWSLAREALQRAEEAGSAAERARALALLGDLHADADDVGAARACWRRALVEYQAIRAPGAEEMRRRLAGAGSSPNG